MNEKETYFTFSKNKETNILSSRTPFKLIEFLTWLVIMLFSIVNLFSFPFLVLWIFILSSTGYFFYRIASHIYYTELHIKNNGELFQIKKVYNYIQKTELITQKFNLKNIEFIKISRIGKTKFLLRYNTHKNHDLLIIKSENDKTIIEDFFNTI